MSKSNSFNMVVSPKGELTYIYDDLHQSFLDKVKAKAVVTRASHVEPNGDGGWTADMSPIEPGVVLGPFALRQDALDAEREWLNKKLFGA